MLAQEPLLRLDTYGGFVGIGLVFESVGFLRGENRHELEFHSDVIGPFGGLFGNFEAKRAVKRREVGQAVRLKKGIGIEITVFDFVEGMVSARGMTEGGHVRDLKGFELTRLQVGNQGFSGLTHPGRL